MTTEQTLGGYVHTHRCPPAFRGSDGVSYTAEIFVDPDPEESGRFGAAMLFIKWSAGSAQPDGHLETAYLAHGETPDEARTFMEGLSLHELKAHLDRLIEERRERPGW